ncbi:Ppx/GppA family phosphatase [Streptomyces actinomycinicus]|uniref:Ppx/GppA family phosphatase n=1 Tax=Streptomyces actinomycinicus TaxID=1695166 RepID=A0A937JN80_9ACTN|nr:Ppx/GppA family phosphatase [Streptomyces actinomycinicus]MBL1084310.1 Ppx/GppA family phosphatase [Streptomyces actinomycinicus]
MRVSVVDAGSNTVRLVIADVEGGVPLPVHTVKWKLRLSEHVDADGTISEEAVERLVKAVAAAGATARQWHAAGPLAFATTVVRNAPNRDEILQQVAAGTGIRMCTMPGETEAELTFLAARRWLGWKAGPLALLDIGGGSLEVAFGRGRMPDFAASLPLGANRLTREHLALQDPPGPGELKELRRRVRHELRDVASRIRWERPRTAAVTSRTFQQLARLCGAAPGRHGPFVARELACEDLREAARTLAALPVAERAQLPGISAPRAAQSLAGAVVGHTALKLMGLHRAVVCPWAIREGVLLRYIEDGADWWTDATDTDATAAPAPPATTLRIATPSA